MYTMLSIAESSMKVKNAHSAAKSGDQNISRSTLHSTLTSKKPPQLLNLKSRQRGLQMMVRLSDSVIVRTYCCMCSPAKEKVKAKPRFTLVGHFASLYLCLSALNLLDASCWLSPINLTCMWEESGVPWHRENIKLHTEGLYHPGFESGTIC